MPRKRSQEPLTLHIREPKEGDPPLTDAELLDVAFQAIHQANEQRDKLVAEITQAYKFLYDKYVRPFERSRKNGTKRQHTV
jgi:hypothetical protein